MSVRWLASTIITLAVLALPGCGGGDSKTPPGPTPPSKPFELDGSWSYLGPSDVPHDLKIDDSSMVYTALGGTDWSSTWTIHTYDNDQHHFQLEFVSGSGTYLPTGPSVSGTYELSGTLLTIQTAQGLSSYPALEDAGTCTGATDGTPVPDCRLYIKAN